MASEIKDFVRRAIEAKISRDEIAKTLAAAQWPEAEIRAALADFAEVAFPIAVPRPRPSLSARDVFTYLVLFGALYTCVWQAVQLLFRAVDQFLPDVSQRPFNEYYQDDTVRWGIATLVVFFPLFAYTFLVVARRLARDPTARASWPRKWLTYLTLALAVCAMAGDLAFLVYSALGGELTVRFVIKSAIVALISGGAFAYYLNDVRAGEEE
jgi:hypothetical protein